MKTIRIDESRTVQAGAVTVTVQADSLEINVDEIDLARGPAEAIAKSMADGIRTAGPATSGTIRQRKTKGIASTTKWYATGTLANGIKAEQDGKGFAIVAPTGRLQDSALVEKLMADVPAVADPMTPAVDKAIEKTADDMIKVRRK